MRATARETPSTTTSARLLALTHAPENSAAVQAVRDGEAKSVPQKKPAPQERPEAGEPRAPTHPRAPGAWSRSTLPEEEAPTWSQDGSAFLERARADVIRIVGELQRLLAKAGTLWTSQRRQRAPTPRRRDARVEPPRARWMEGAGSPPPTPT